MYRYLDQHANCDRVEHTCTIDPSMAENDGSSRRKISMGEANVPAAKGHVAAFAQCKILILPRPSEYSYTIPVWCESEQEPVPISISETASYNDNTIISAEVR